MLQTKTKQKIGDKEYEIEFPNVGQTLEIENLKMLLSGNSYGQLVKSGHNTASQLLNLIDGTAYFSVLAKGFRQDFNIENFTDIDAVTQRMISTAFISFWEWYRNVEESLNQTINETISGKKDEQDNK